MDCVSNNIKAEGLKNLKTTVTDNIFSDFGNKEEFLNEVKMQKIKKGKEDLNKIIEISENGELIKKRL